MIMKLISVLFLFGLTSMAFATNLRSEVKKGTKPRFFVMRSQWDDRCVASVKGNIVLVKDCTSLEAVWKTDNEGFAKVTFKNFKSEKYLGFKQGQKAPQLFDKPNNNTTAWKFNVLHKKNRRWPNDQSYWNISYHTVENLGTNQCLTVDGDFLYQLKCMPGKPESLSFEVVDMKTVQHGKIKSVVFESKLKKYQKLTGTPLVFPPTPKRGARIPKRPCLNK